MCDSLRDLVYNFNILVYICFYEFMHRRDYTYYQNTVKILDQVYIFFT